MKIGALARHGCLHQKIGITNNPEARWKRHQRAGWQRMDLLYRSDVFHDVTYLERKLIDRFRDGLTRTPGYYYNATGGGAGRKPGRGPFYVYVIGARAYARIG
jgi:hypothetical protein